MIKLSYVDGHNDQYSHNVTIEMPMSTDCTIEQILRTFEKFLLATGYIFNPITTQLMLVDETLGETAECESTGKCCGNCAGHTEE